MKTWFSALTLSLFAITASHADIKTLQKNLSTQYPEIKVESVNKTPFSDIYEVYMNGRIVYTDEAAKYFFVGNLIDLKQQKNLTEERERVLSSIDIAKLPLNQAVKHVKGNGSRSIYLFSDPDCPYCQQLEKELQKVDNLTIYLFVNPIARLHPNATQISKQILCAAQPYQSWQNYLINKQQPPAKSDCETSIAQNIALAKQLKVDGTPTFFLQDGSRISGVRSAGEIELLLKEAAK